VNRRTGLKKAIEDVGLLEIGARVEAKDRGQLRDRHGEDSAKVLVLKRGKDSSQGQLEA